MKVYNASVERKLGLASKDFEQLHGLLKQESPRMNFIDDAAFLLSPSVFVERLSKKLNSYKHICSEAGRNIAGQMELVGAEVGMFGNAFAEGMQTRVFESLVNQALNHFPLHRERLVGAFGELIHMISPRKEVYRQKEEPFEEEGEAVSDGEIAEAEKWAQDFMDLMTGVKAENRKQWRENVYGFAISTANAYSSDDLNIVQLKRSADFHMRILKSLRIKTSETSGQDKV